MTGAREKFTELYRQGGWHGLGSGPGSTLKMTEGYRAYVEEVIRVKKVHSVLDLGCGDWQFSKAIHWKKVRYSGIDFVAHVIADLRKQHGLSYRTFICGDIFECEWPEADLLLIKDLIHHISFDETDFLIRKAAEYRVTLWTFEAEDDGTPKNCSPAAVKFFGRFPIGYEFDRTVEPYPYGRKITKLVRKCDAHYP